MLMDHAARDVMEEYKDIVLAFGESDEYRSDGTPIPNRSAVSNPIPASYFVNQRRCTTVARARFAAR